MRTGFRYLLAVVTGLLISGAAVAVCYSAKDIKDAECATACRREGTKTGYYVEKANQCACVDFYDYSRLTRKVPVRLRLESQGTTSVTEAPQKQQGPVYFSDDE